MKKVLAVDDSEVNLFLVQSIFADDPEIEVVIESKSSKALNLMKKDLPDILILDLMMPETDGFMLLKQIKTDSLLSKVPVIIISAREDKDTMIRAKELGIEHYFAKPVNLKVIEKTIRSLI